jgi:putative nucleotidyltransferase with HDIG domain
MTFSSENSQAGSLVAVDIQSFRSATRDINFDVYLKLSEDNHAHVFSRSTGLDYKRLAQYIYKGVQQLYIKHEDLEAYSAFIARPAHMIFSDPATTQEKKIATLLNMTEQNMAELFSQVAVNEDTAVTSQRVIKNYVGLMAESPNTLAIILKLVSHGEYLYYHSIAVAIFSMFIAKASGQFDQRTMEFVGMGGFLHDIGCTQLPKEIVCSPGELTDDQWHEMHEHPKMGLRLIESTPTIPNEVRHIVYQHHEDSNGKGYPNGLHGSTIYYPAKIVALADTFSALISKRPFRPAFTVEQAFAILQSKESRHDPELVRIMASVFLRQGNKLPTKKAA